MNELTEFFYDILKFLFVAAISLICVGAVFCLLVAICNRSNTIEENTWNNGIHAECGGSWVYEEPVGHAAGTSYLYHCDKCGKAYEFWERR